MDEFSLNSLILHEFDKEYGGSGSSSDDLICIYNY